MNEKVLLGEETQVSSQSAEALRIEFFGAKEDVLLTLIENPDFCSDAERTILEKLDKLAFSSSKKKILKAISDRKNQD